MSVPIQTAPTTIRSMPPPIQAPRLRFIDGLRGLAMLMVLTFHCWVHSGAWRVDIPLGHHHINLAAPIGLGYTGVSLFLVLSGFCLYWPFVKVAGRPEPTLWQFAKKRCRRILPPYYAAVALFGGMSLFTAFSHHAPTQTAFTWNWLWLHALMLHNTQPSYIATIDPPLWSLELEFQLYILFPLFVEAFRRFSAPTVLIAVLLFCAAFRGCIAHTISPLPLYSQAVLVQSVFSRCFEFAAGMFAARFVADWYADSKAPMRRMKPALVAGVFAALALLDLRILHLGLVSDAKWGVLYAVLLVAASRPAGLLHRYLSQSWIVSCGFFSYSVYLIHEPLIIQIRRLADMWHLAPVATILLLMLVAAPLMLGLGYLFHRLFEKPFMTPQRTAPRLPPAPVTATATHLAISE